MCFQQVRVCACVCVDARRPPGKKPLERVRVGKKKPNSFRAEAAPFLSPAPAIARASHQEWVVGVGGCLLRAVLVCMCVLCDLGGGRLVAPSPCSYICLCGCVCMMHVVCVCVCVVCARTTRTHLNDSSKR